MSPGRKHHSADSPHSSWPTCDRRLNPLVESHRDMLSKWVAMVHEQPQNQSGFTSPQTCNPRTEISFTVTAKNDTEGRSSLQNSLDPLETCETDTLGTQCWTCEAWQILALFSNPGDLTPKDRSRSIAPWWQFAFDCQGHVGSRDGTL